MDHFPLNNLFSLSLINLFFFSLHQLIVPPVIMSHSKTLSAQPQPGALCGVVQET